MCGDELLPLFTARVAHSGTSLRGVAAAWVVECTFARFGYNRRLRRDYERLPQTSETMIYLAMTRLMLCRLKPL